MLHTESSTSILFALSPKDQQAGAAPVFLNPVQEYNRDLSVVAIRTWSDLRQKAKVAHWEEGIRRKWAKRKSKGDDGGVGAEAGAKRRKVGEQGVPVPGEGLAPEASGDGGKQGAIIGSETKDADVSNTTV